nr:hypothetical protein [Tanacetum cinerariifolium]
ILYRVSTRSETNCEGPCRLEPKELKEFLEKLQEMQDKLSSCLSKTFRSTQGLRRSRVAFEDEFGAAEEREVSCEARQGRSRVKRELFRSCRNNMGNEPILALPKGSENFVVMPGARVRMCA